MIFDNRDDGSPDLGDLVGSERLSGDGQHHHDHNSELKEKGLIRYHPYLGVMEWCCLRCCSTRRKLVFRRFVRRERQVRCLKMRVSVPFSARSLSDGCNSFWESVSAPVRHGRQSEVSNFL